MEGLPFPDPLALDGSIVMEYINIKSMTVKNLEKFCHMFGLTPSFRQKDGYLESLRIFSADEEAWKALRHGVNVRRHKGPRSSGARKPKLSSIRWEALFSGAQGSIGSGTTGSTTSGVDISGEKLSAWALALPVAPSLPMAPSLPVVPSDPSVMSTSISETLSTAACTETLIAHNACVPSALSRCQMELYTDITPLLSSFADHGHFPAPFSSVSSPVNQRQFTLSLACGKLCFYAADIPTPSAGIPFVVEGLAPIWDDSSIYWLGSSPLMIRSVPIALKYWPKIYGNRNFSTTWTRIKQTWHQWKFVMEEYHSMSSSCFWGKWSRDSKKLNFTPSNFTQNFRYRRGGAHMICQMDHTLARYYRNLKSLPSKCN
ncbi:hypothetical protein L208DRAFT_1414922 [Tricholoma matsutake]|nr:hypothetical protein L208DRAFT_1414922 [Tricholoma matsutake 945]